MEYTYKSLTISLDIDVVTVHDLYIKEEINQHAYLVIKGICREDSFHKMTDQIDDREKIRIRNNNGQQIYSGFITSLLIEEKGQLHSFVLEAFSSTYQMDLVKRKRVFQDLDMTYCQVLDKVLEQYQTASYIDKISGDKKIPCLLIQYEETDWEFIKRLASHFADGLYADSSCEGIQFSFGRPVNEVIHEINRQPEQVVTDLIRKQMTHCIESYEKYEIGDTVKNRNITGTVRTESLCIRQQEVWYKTTMIIHKEECFPYIANHAIAHKREWAEIVEVKRNQLKLRFIMEEVIGSNLPFFPFEGEQNNEIGFYMSDIGTRVLVYFPNEEEKNGVVVSADRERENVPDNSCAGIKYLKNQEGNQLKMTGKVLEFSTGGKDTVLKLTPDGNLQMNASNTLKIFASGSIQMGGSLKRLQMSAGKEIRLKAGKTGNHAVIFDENGNIECRCGGNLIYRKINGSSSSAPTLGSGISSGASEARDAALALAGTEFVSQAVTGNADFSDAGKIMGRFTGQNPGAVSGTEDDNPIKSGLFQNNDRLYHAFSYGENKNGNKH